MGRAKLRITYRENARARRATYLTRVEGLKKKASELSKLCGVHILVASSSPELKTVEFWPEKNTPEFFRITNRYLGFRTEKSCSGDSNPTESPSTPFPLLSLKDEKAALEIKLKEVKERLEFLQQKRQGEEQQLQADQFSIYMPLEPQPFSVFSYLAAESNTQCLDDLNWCDSLLLDEQSGGL